MSNILSTSIAVKCSKPWQMAQLATRYEQNGLTPKNYQPNLFTAGYMLIKCIGNHYTNCMFSHDREIVDFEKLNG